MEVPSPPGGRAGNNSEAGNIQIPLAEEALRFLEDGMETTFLSEEVDQQKQRRTRTRRSSVSAAPSGCQPPTAYQMPFHDKSPEDQSAVRDVLMGICIFQEVRGRELENLVGAFKEVMAEEGEVDAFILFDHYTVSIIIHQGEDGDNFYIVSGGHADVFIKVQKKSRTTEGERSATEAEGMGSEAHSASGDKLGTLVLEVGPGGYFGELALMYHCPRAATVRARDTMRLFAIDSATFTSILRSTGQSRREDYLAFLHHVLCPRQCSIPRLFSMLSVDGVGALQVPVLQGLSDEERGKVADVLVAKKYDGGEYIIRQGETEANHFHMLFEGSACIEVAESAAGTPTKRALSVSHSKQSYERGDYFGELALIRKAPRSVSVIAQQQCTTVCIDRAAFLRLLGPVLDSFVERSDSYVDVSSDVLQDLNDLKRKRSRR